MFRSLRYRLQAWHTLILLLVVTGFGGTLYVETSRRRFDEIDGELLAAARVLEGVLRTQSPAPRPPGGPAFRGGPPPDRPPRPREGPGPPGKRLMPLHPPRFQPNALSLPHSLMDRYSEPGEEPYFVVRDASGNLLLADPPEFATHVPPDPSVGRWYESHSRNRGPLREVTLLGPARTTILVGRPIHHELGGLRRMAWQLGLTGLGVFLAGCAGGWWLSSRAVRPIFAMSETVSAINASSLSKRVDLAGVDTELGSLGTLINTMLERLEGSFEQQVRFTADASHELRTPLTVILTQVELALSRPREAAAYRESLEACGRAATRMKSLVDDLLTLARADSGKLELRLEPIDLARITDGSVALLQPLAHERGVRILREISPAPLDGDPERLGQVITNLVSNAIQYTQPGGKVVISTRCDGSSATLSVEDTGVGIPERDLPLVFDRFHRVDSARSRGSGGSGLGLAICQSIVEAHGGAIAVASTLDRGSRFTVTIPMQYRHRDADSMIQG